MEQVGVQFIAAGGDVYITTVNNATKATRGFVDETESGGKRVSGAGQVMIGALRQIGTIAVDALGQALKATTAFVKGSIDVAGDFEAGMNDVKIAVGQSLGSAGVGLDDFRNDFIQLGKELPVSTSDVQQAFISLVKGGVDPLALHMGALRDSVNFATAADMDQVAAADLSAKQLGIWTKATATATEQNDFLIKSHDLMVRAANASTVGVADLGAGMNVAGGIAAALNIDYRDFAVTMAELAPGFNNTTEAGTAYKNFLARIQPTTKPAISAMQDLGLYTEENGSAFFDATGKYVGNRQAAELLAVATRGLTDEQKAQALQTIFGNDAMGAAVKLANDGGAGYDIMSAKIDNASGVTASAALKQQGFNTAMENAKGSVEALQITLGTVFLPILTDLMNNTITPAINTVTEFASAIFKADNPLVALSNAIDTALPGFNEFGTFVENLSTALMAGDWGGAFDVLAQGLSDLGATIGPPLIEALNTASQMAFDWIIAQAPAWLDQLMVWGEQLAEWVAPYVPVVLDALNDLVNDAWAWVQQQAPGWLAQLGVWGEQLIAWIGPMIPPALVELGKLGQGLLNWIGQQAPPLLAELQTWAQSFVAWIPGATVKFLAEWPKMFNSFLDWIGNQAGPLLLKLGTWGVQFVAWILPKIPDILVALAGIVAAMVIWIGETAVTLGIKILQWAKVFDDWARKEVVPKIPGILHNIDVAMWAWADTAKTALYKKMIEVGTGLVDGLKKGATDAWGRFKSYVDGLANQLPEWFKAAYGIHSPSQVMADEIGMPLIQGIAQGMLAAAPALYGLVGQVGSQLVINAGNKINDAIRAENQRITDGLNGMVKDIQTKIAGLNISILTGGADIDRQKAANLSAMDELSAHAKEIAQQQLADAAKVAATLNDPQQQADYFKARSDAILEMAKLQSTLDAQLSGKDRQALEAQVADLQKQIGETTNEVFKASMQQLLNKDQGILDASNLRPSQIAALQQQIALINSAQKKEGQAQTLTMAQGSQTTDLAAEVNDFLGQVQTVKDSPITVFNPLVQSFQHLADALTAQVSAPVSAAQFAAGGTSTQYNNSRTINMPVYTNQSPSAIQQSAAIVGAML